MTGGYDSCACGDAWCRGCARGADEERRLAEEERRLAAELAEEIDDAGPWLPATCPQCGQAAVVRTVGLRAVAASGGDESLATCEWAGRGVVL